MTTKKSETSEKKLEKYAFPQLDLIIEAESLEDAQEKAKNHRLQA